MLSRKSPLKASLGAKRWSGEAVQAVPMFAQVNEHLVDFVVAGNVAAEHEFGAEFGRHFTDALFQFVDNVGECQFRALFAAGFGDAVSDGTLRDHAGNQNFFALQKAPFSYPLAVVLRLH